MAAAEEPGPADRHAALAREYDDFYGAGAQAPMGAIAACGDQVAAETAVAGL